jgi:hypothetical protein
MAETDADVGIAPPPDQAAPAPAPAAPDAANAPAAGSEGRTVVVHARPPPKPPPAPIKPHETAPVSVQPAVVAPSAPGQEPPPAAPKGESDKDVGIEPYPGLATDIGKGAWGGLAEGTEGLLGLPHDIPKLADYGLAWAGAHVNQALGGEDAQEALQRTHGSLLRGALGDNVVNAAKAFLPDAMQHGAADWQRAFQKIGIDPGYKPQSALGRYAHEIAAFAPGAVIPFGEAGMATRLAQTVAPAIGSETLGNLAKGTAWEPWARLAGAGLGGITHTGIASYTAPMRASGQADLASQDLRAATDNPDAALAKLRAAQAQRQPGMATGENVPGSQPTTAQITGDYGQVAAERAYQSGEGQAAHGQRMAEQSAAQTKAARGVQPTGEPQTVADMITKRLQDIDAQHELNVGVRQQAHASTLQNMEQQARSAAGQVARKGEPEALGEAARKPLAESMARAKEQEKRLWDAIDAKKIGVWTNQVGARARNIAKNIGLQKPPSGEEKAILDTAGNLPRWTKLSDLTDLTSRLKAEMRNERFTNGNTPALRRMTELLKTSENVIKAAATRQSAAEAKAEMEGLRRMTPEDRTNIMKARAATKARGDIERGPAGAIVRQGATSGTYRTLASQVPGKIFAAGPTGYQKLKAYTEALGKPHMDPVHDIVADSLSREATTDGMVDAAKLNRWQAKYSDALRALPDEIRQKFVRGPGEAGEALAEGAAARREALIAHSKLDIAKEMGKQAPEAEAIRSNPALKAFEGVDNPRDVQSKVGGIMSRPDAVTRLGELRKHLAGTPAADGLKRAALDHVLEKTLSTAEAGTTGEKMLQPGNFQKFVAKNRAALKAAGLSDQQLGVLDKISGDLERQQRFNATKVRTGSDTGQNISKTLKQIAKGVHEGSGLLPMVLAGKEIYERLPESLHGVAGITAAAAGYGAHKVLSATRHRGLAKAQDLYHEAVMHPDVAADLLGRSTPGRLARLRRHAMYAGLAAERTAALRH